MSPGVLKCEILGIGFGVSREVSGTDMVKFVQLLVVELIYSSMFTGNCKHVSTLVKGSVDVTFVEAVHGVRYAEETIKLGSHFWGRSLVAVFEP